MKTFWNFLKSKFLWINILSSILIVFLICAIVSWRLDVYTHHGESIEMPDLSGLYVEEAELILKDCGLTYEVVDSVYLRSLRGGEIAEQSPAAGTRVKKNREVYLTINKMNRRMITIPDLLGESRRKVQSNLTSLGFRIDTVKYRAYEYNDEVLELMYKGDILTAGSKVPDGASIVMIVGRNDRSIEVVVPNLVGLTLPDAKDVINKSRLTFGSVYYDITPLDSTDVLSYRIYDQTPEAGVVVSGGKSVELKASKNNKNNDEEFF